jgi:flagellar hook-basal body complex protein FliE
MKISQTLGVLPGAGTENQNPLSRSGKQTGESFTDVLRDSIASVNSMQAEAGKAVDGMVRGDTTDLHDVMIAVEKAKTSFDLLMEVRNKALDTYREMMRIQV